MASTAARSKLLSEPASWKETSVGKRPEPSAATVQRIRNYVRTYWKKTGTVGHPDSAVTEAVIKGLAANME
jgi:hypothetical protein